MAEWIRRYPGRVLVGLLFCVCSCHRATPAECEQMLDRIIELELRDQGVADPELIKRRTVETKARRQQELLRGCVGERVSQASLQCVLQADSGVEITDRCLR